MATLITTCTHCGAKFCVTEQHLSAADGLVVCSRCHGIFQARDTLQAIPEKKPKAVDNSANPAFLFGSNIRSGRSRRTTQTEADTSHNPPEQPTPAVAAATADMSDDAVDADTANSAAPEAATKTGFFARLFGGRKPATEADSVATAQPENKIAAEEAISTLQTEETDTPAAQTQADKPENTEAVPPAAATAPAAEHEEFSSVPEPQDGEQLALENKEEQVFLPGAHGGSAPSPYDPRFDPRLYLPGPSREEMNWTMASIVALIVLIIQLFYIILQK